VELLLEAKADPELKEKMVVDMQHNRSTIFSPARSQSFWKQGSKIKGGTKCRRKFLQINYS